MPSNALVRIIGLYGNRGTLAASTIHTLLARMALAMLLSLTFWSMAS